MKRIMKTIAMAAMLIAAMALPAFAADAPQRPVLSVDGAGQAEAAPDMATVVLGVTTHARDAATAQNDNAHTAGMIQQSVRALGIPAKDIQTTNYTFRPTYRTEENHQNEISGYTVDNSIVVTVKDIKQTGKVIDAALKSGANTVSSLSFGATDTKAVREAALQKACADARTKANVIAKSLGCRIVGIQNVTESTGDLGVRRYNAPMLMAMKAGNSADTPIEAGTLTMQANVHIDFILANE